MTDEQRWNRYLRPYRLRFYGSFITYPCIFPAMFQKWGFVYLFVMVLLILWSAKLWYEMDEAKHPE